MKHISEYNVEVVNTLLRHVGQREVEIRVIEEAEDFDTQMHVLADPRFFGSDYD